MKTPYDVVLSPVISEKSYSLIDQNKYTFIVHPDASKTEISQAVEEIFKVKVSGVNTIKIRPKPRRRGMIRGRTNHKKKAVVTLKEGYRIEFFEGPLGAT